MRGRARSVECKCDHHTTCAHCLRNAPTWHWTSTPETFEENNARWLAEQAKKQGSK